MGVRVPSGIWRLQLTAGRGKVVKVRLAGVARDHLEDPASESRSVPLAGHPEASEQVCLREQPACERTSPQPRDRKEREGCPSAAGPVANTRDDLPAVARLASPAPSSG